MSGRGIFFLVAGPTAAGKTTLVKRLVSTCPGLVANVSVTTRAPRAGEVDGVDRHFWDRGRFEDAVKQGAFLEHAVVHGHEYYGTRARDVEELLDQGIDVIKDIDVQGVEQVRGKMPYPRSVSIFVVPPSPEDLERRFRDRGTEDEAALKKRLDSARKEIQSIGEYDYLVFNDLLEDAVEDFRAIRRAEGLRRARRQKDFERQWRDAW